MQPKEEARLKLNAAESCLQISALKEAIKNAKAANLDAAEIAPFEACVDNFRGKALEKFWVAIDSKMGVPVGFCENYIESSTCFYNSAWFLPSALKNYVSYALFYDMNKHYLGDRGFRYVSDGARCLSHSTNIHNFLLTKFRFRKAYASLNVSYVLWLHILIFLLFPFRGILSYFSFSFTNKLSILLSMEAIRRSCKNCYE